MEYIIPICMMLGFFIGLFGPDNDNSTQKLTGGIFGAIGAFFLLAVFNGISGDKR